MVCSIRQAQAACSCSCWRVADCPGSSDGMHPVHGERWCWCTIGSQAGAMAEADMQCSTPCCVHWVKWDLREHSPAASFNSMTASLILQAVASLLRLRDVVQQFIARQDSERVSAFLYAASYGDASTVRQVRLPGDHATCTGLCWALHCLMIAAPHRASLYACYTCWCSACHVPPASSKRSLTV